MRCDYLRPSESSNREQFSDIVPTDAPDTLYALSPASFCALRADIMYERAYPENTVMINANAVPFNGPKIMGADHM